MMKTICIKTRKVTKQEKVIEISLTQEEAESLVTHLDDSTDEDTPIPLNFFFLLRKALQ